MAGSVPALTRKNVLFPLLGIDLLQYPIYFELWVWYGLLFTKLISISNFAYIAATKPGVSAEIIGIKYLYYHPVDHF